eukprot:8766208-Pyramimonas_sp.AAC.1
MYERYKLLAARCGASPVRGMLPILGVYALACLAHERLHPGCKESRLPPHVRNGLHIAVEYRQTKQYTVTHTIPLSAVNLARDRKTCRANVSFKRAYRVRSGQSQVLCTARLQVEWTEETTPTPVEPIIESLVKSRTDNKTTAVPYTLNVYLDV